MKNWFVTVCCTMLFVMPLGVMGQSGKSLEKEVVELWRNFEISGKDTVKAILNQGEKVKKYIESKDRDNANAFVENGCELMRRLLVYYRIPYIKDNKVLPVTHRKEIKKWVDAINIYSKEFVAGSAFSLRVDQYFDVRALSKGASVDQVFGKEENDKYAYEKYKELLESGNKEVILKYFPYLRSVFMYSGYTPALKRIRPLLEQKMPEGKEKDELMVRFERAERVEPGKPAPAFTMKDASGKERSLSDYRGKILVVDVWATWCSGCVAKLPYYVKLAEKYKGRNDIEFITVSQDRNWDDWQKGIVRLKATALTNLFERGSFAEDYNIPGIPLYMIIDEEGNFIISKVSLSTIGDHLEGLEKLIEEILNKRK